MARQESGSCPPGSTPSCVTYQRFHLGYVWVSNALQVTATFCPDVFPLPDGDGIVASNDAQWVFNLYQHGTYDARADLNGDGQIASTEAQLVFAFFKQGFGTCHP